MFLIFKFLGKILCFYLLNKTCSVLVSHGLYLPRYFKQIALLFAIIVFVMVPSHAIA